MKVTVTVELNDGMILTLPMEVTGADNPIFAASAAGRALMDADGRIHALLEGAYGKQRLGGIHTVTGGATDA